MHRSASWSRFSDDYFKQVTASPSSVSRLSASTFDDNNLPTFDPIAELAKREKARVRFAENAVHVIPLVLFLCAIILWFFSNPDVGMKGDPMRARIEGLNLEGEFDHDIDGIDGTQTGILPIMNSGDISTKEFGAESVSVNHRTFR